MYDLEKETLPASWSDFEYRTAFLESWVEQNIAWQVRLNREARCMSQNQLALKIGTKQSAISRLENADCPNYRLTTLLKIAEAFDCALDVRLIPYAELHDLTKDNSPEALIVQDFNKTLKLTGVSNG